MSKKTFLTLALALLVVGCSDITAPIDEANLPKNRLGSLGRITRTVTQRLTGTIESVVAGLLPENTLVQSEVAPRLMSYDTSFVAIQGQVASLDLYYLNPVTGGPGDKFLYIEIPEDAQLLTADGTPAATGEPVEITVQIDETSFFVQLGPHGATFNGDHGTALEINIKHALNLDLNRGTPTIWYQPIAGQVWADEGTSVYRDGNWIFVQLKHFSNYAVAW